jgi:hypothetical protein
VSIRLNFVFTIFTVPLFKVKFTPVRVRDYLPEPYRVFVRYAVAVQNFAPTLDGGSEFLNRECAFVVIATPASRYKIG